MSKEGSKDKPKETESTSSEQKLSPHYKKRLDEFWAKNAKKYELGKGDYERIAKHLIDGSLSNIGQIVANAQSRTNQRGMPFMDAVESIVEDNKEKKFKFGQREAASQKPEPKEKHDQRRLKEFLGKNRERYGISDEDYQEITGLLESGDLTRFDQVTAMARSRADQRGIPFMDAVRSVVKDTKKRPSEKPVEKDPLSGLDELKAKLGYPGETGKLGDIIKAPRDPRTFQREKNFDDAQIPEEKKTERKTRKK